MNPSINRQWLLAKRPEGAVTPEDFNYSEAAVPTAADGDILVRSLYFSFDASQRIWITNHGGYLPPVQIGEAMRTMGIGQVVESRNPNYAVGDLVEGFLTWQDYNLARADGPMPLRILPNLDIPLTWHLGIFGVSGLTAYFGVTDILKIQPGDTVVVSAASGSLGSLVAGICKAAGAERVIGIAGGAEKCRWIVEEAGYDDAIDYKNDDISARLAELCPEGVNAYFDNAGGDILDTLFLHMAPRGRVLICGAMASGYTDVQIQGPRNYMAICTKMLRVEGILLLFYKDRLQEGAEQMAKWAAEGKFKIEEKIFEGFEKAPELMPTMFSGKAPGKLLLKIADPV